MRASSPRVQARPRSSSHVRQIGHSRRTGELCVRNHVHCDGYGSDIALMYGEACKASVPYPNLDLSTTYSPTTRTLYLHAVNRGERDVVERSFQLRGAAPATGTAHDIAGSGPNVHNTFSQPDAVRLAHQPMAQAGSESVHVFPPLSVTVLELR
jgi:alpha-L-arabinofuranosidase